MAVSLIAEEESKGGRRQIYKETAANPANATAGTQVNVDLTIAGITTSDKILNACINGGAASAGGVVLQSAYCQAANTVRLVYSNPSAGAIDLNPHEVVFEVLKLS